MPRPINKNQRVRKLVGWTHVIGWYGDTTFPLESRRKLSWSLFHILSSLNRQRQANFAKTRLNNTCLSDSHLISSRLRQVLYICHIFPRFLPWMGTEPDPLSILEFYIPNDDSTSSWQASSRRFNCTCLSNRLNLNLILRFVGSNNSGEEDPWLRVWCIKSWWWDIL